MNSILCSSVKPFKQIPSKSSSFFPISLDFLLRGGPAYLHEHLSIRHEELGPIIREKMGQQNLVSITDTSLIRKVMLGDDRYPRPPLPPAWTHYMKVKQLERGLFFQQDAKWYRTRHALDRILLDSDRIDKSTYGALQIAQDLIELMISGPNNLSTGGGNLVMENLKSKLSLWSVETIYYILTGNRLGCLPDHRRNIGQNPDAVRFVQLTDQMLELSADLNLVPVEMAQRLSLKIWRRFEACMEELIKIARDLSEAAIANCQSDSMVRDIRMGGQLDHEDLVKNLIDFLIASVDTTASSAIWTLHMLSREADIQSIARTEIRQALGETVESDEYSNLFHNQHYLDAVIRESMRLYPPAPFISRLLTKDLTLANYEVPRGTLVVLPFLTIGRLETYFEDPLSVKPERWIKDSAHQCPMRHQPLASLPFGVGPRMCIARKMANLELKCLLTSLMSDYKFQPRDDRLDVKPKLRLTTWPSKPIELKLEKI